MGVAGHPRPSRLKRIVVVVLLVVVIAPIVGYFTVPAVRSQIDALIEARDQAGDQGAASRARLGYDQMLAELGVIDGATGSSPI